MLKKLLAVLRCHLIGHPDLQPLRGLWAGGYSRCHRCDGLVHPNGEAWYGDED